MRLFLLGCALSATLVALACGASSNDPPSTPADASADSEAAPDRCEMLLPDGGVWFTCQLGEVCTHPDGCNSCRCASTAGETSMRCTLIGCGDAS